MDDLSKNFTSLNEEPAFWAAANRHLTRYGPAFEEVIVERAEGVSFMMRMTVPSSISPPAR